MMLCSAFVLAICISCTVSFSLRKGCVKVKMDDIEIENIGPLMNASGTNLYIVENDGNSGISGTLSFAKDVPPTTEVKWEVFSINANNEPKKTVEGKKTTICSFLVDDRITADLLVKNSDLPATCPINKGVYEVRNAQPDESTLPCRAPGTSNSWFSKFAMSDPVTKQPVIEVITKFRLVK